MPSEKVLGQKKEIVDSLVEKLKNAKAGVLVDYKGITVEDDTKLRSDLRNNNVEYFVVKNTLLRLAANEVGLSELDSVLHGTSALALSTEDEMAPARVLNGFAKKHDKFTFKAGIFEGKVVDANFVKGIAELPSKPILVSMVLGGLNAPITKLACVIDAIAKQKAEA